MERGYFYVRSDKRHDWLGYNMTMTKELMDSYCSDKVYYDVFNEQEPSNKKFLNIVVNYSKINDTIVIPSLLHLGITVETISKWLEVIRTKQVRLKIKNYEVNISSLINELEEYSSYYLDELDDKLAKLANITESEKNLYRNVISYKKK